MSHGLDKSLGFFACAINTNLVKGTWHDLHRPLTDPTNLELCMKESGIDWQAIKAPLTYSVGGKEYKVEDRDALCRNDTFGLLDIVSRDRYHAHQPRDIVKGCQDLAAKYGFELETMGALNGGQQIWASFNCSKVYKAQGAIALLEPMDLHMLWTTDFARKKKTTGLFTPTCTVCQNTLGMALNNGTGRSEQKHNAPFDAEQMKLEMGIGDAWEKHQAYVQLMAKLPISQDDTKRFLANVYFALENDADIRAYFEREENQPQLKKYAKRWQTAMFEAPGATLDCRKGTLWGAVNAVTYDIDHLAAAHTVENRFASSQWGKGAAIKTRAWDRALEIIEGEFIDETKLLSAA